MRYAIRNAEGLYFKGRTSWSSKERWVASSERARLYTRVGDIKQTIRDGELRGVDLTGAELVTFKLKITAFGSIGHLL